MAGSLSSFEIEKRINNAKNIVELKKELIKILSTFADDIRELDNRTWK